MTAESPYTPPTTEVRDIPPSAYKKRLVQRMVRFLDNQPRRLARHRALGWIGSILALACLLVATAFADGRSDPFPWIMVAALGGFLGGLSVVFRASGRNWPILRRYFDVDRLRADCEKMRD